MSIRKIIIALAYFTFTFGQSVHNAHGLGLLIMDNHASSLGIASRGIVPSFYRDISLANPVTWNNLKNAYLIGSYTGDEYSSALGNNGISGLSNVQFSVPIAEKFAFGFGIKPVFNQKYLVTDDSLLQFIDSDTLELQRSLDGEGGLSSFYCAFNFPLTVYEQIALEWDVFFGSLRKNTQLSIDGSTYHYFQRQIYSGNAYKIFFSSNRLKKTNLPLNIYAMLGGSLSPLKVAQYSFQPFEDLNNNGYFDSADKPSPSDIPNAAKSTFKNIFNPAETGLGLSYQYLANSYLILELHHWSDHSSKPQLLYQLQDYYISTSDQYSLGILRFAHHDAFKFTQQLQYRGGVYYRKDQLYIDENSVLELGFSLGMGIKFGATNNQIDIAYKYGLRNSNVLPNEYIQQFSVGIQLGDRWFIKRRPK